jgi:conjugative relaxase-like TrwC/TraI family protein
MTLHKLSAGDGYAYYTSETATGDAKREQGRELGDYYTADGNPPGVWFGSGLAALGVSGTVTEEQMKALYGEGLHPNAEQIITDAQAAGKSVEEATEAAKLGSSYYAYGTGGSNLSAAIEEGYARFQRTEHREPDVNERRTIRVREGAQAFRQAKGRQPADKEELGRYITAATRPTRQAVAGFDLVFSPAKSVSTLWALGDNDTRKAIEQAQDAAIADTVAYLEREAIATRAGKNGVAQIDVDGGIVATKFRHYDSRNGDPQLHDHLVIANKVKGSDGKWRTIDSKLLHRQGVAASEFYNARVMERVSEALGVVTELREVTAGKRPVVEIAGVDDRLTKGFSTRSTEIRKTLRALEKDYRRDHGRQPDQAARIKLAQQATLETRPAKEHARSLASLRETWQARAAEVIGARGIADMFSAVRAAAERNTSTDEPQPLDVESASRQVVDTVSEHHATWGPHMIEAEARRYVQAARIAGVDVPEGAVETITRHALDTDSVSVTPPAPHGAFQPLTRQDGESIYVHKGRAVYTSAGILAAEDRLIDAARTRTLAPVSVAEFDRTAAEHTGPLDDGQRNLAREFTTSDRLVLVGTGPAGAGKTTALALAARATEQAGSRMIGLAPSAAAADVFKDAVGVEANTIHGFLKAYELHGDATPESEHPAGMKLRAGDVVVVDEAGMAGTRNLARVVDIAEAHGAHVRLIGDSRQLDAVESGGALRLLEREVGSVQLDTIHRFRNADGTVNQAEADASERLRDPATTGDPFAWYVDEGRVVGGDVERMTGEVFAAWQADASAGKRSVMLAQQNATVAELNARAQAFRISEGAVTGREAASLRDGLRAHRGDTIVTRQNDSRLRTDRGRDRVKNNDLWTVDKVNRDGSLSVTHEGHGGRITLPAEYVREHVELGYASTVHRAQGLTADTSHVLADASTSRALAYVAMTRGKESNRLYVEVDDAQPVSDVLGQIAGNSEGMMSANETIRAEQARVDDLVTLVDQYRDVSERADEVRFEKITRTAVGAEAAQQLRDDEGWGALRASLRGAERAGYDPADALYQAWEKDTLDNARNKPAVLAARVQGDVRAYTSEFGTADRDDRVPAWLVDRGALDSQHTDPAWREHLAERYDYIAVRMEERGATIAVEQPEWAKELGAVPADAERRSKWNRLAAEVEAFRGRYAIEESTPEAIPNQYRKRAVGAELQQRVTAMHKSAALVKELPAELSTRVAASERTSTVAERMREQNRVKAAKTAEQLRNGGVPGGIPQPLDRDRDRDRDRQQRDARQGHKSVERVWDDDARER